MDVPMMLLRMRCPQCLFDYRFGVPIDTPLYHLPEITKNIMRCRCKNHIPKIDKNTPIEQSLMSINGKPFWQLAAQVPLNELKTEKAKQNGKHIHTG